MPDGVVVAAVSVACFVAVVFEVVRSGAARSRRGRRDLRGGDRRRGAGALQRLRRGGRDDPADDDLLLDHRALDDDLLDDLRALDLLDELLGRVGDERQRRGEAAAREGDDAAGAGGRRDAGQAGRDALAAGDRRARDAALR